VTKTFQVRCFMQQECCAPIRQRVEDQQAPLCNNSTIWGFTGGPADMSLPGSTGGRGDAAAELLICRLNCSSSRCGCVHSSCPATSAIALGIAMTEYHHLCLSHICVLCKLTAPTAQGLDGHHPMTVPVLCGPPLLLLGCM
jgi:hypothetical protein